MIQHTTGTLFFIVHAGASGLRRTVEFCPQELWKLLDNFLPEAIHSVSLHALEDTPTNDDAGASATTTLLGVMLPSSGWVATPEAANLRKDLLFRNQEAVRVFYDCLQPEYPVAGYDELDSLEHAHFFSTRNNPQQMQ